MDTKATVIDIAWATGPVLEIEETHRRIRVRQADHELMTQAIEVTAEWVNNS